MNRAQYLQSLKQGDPITLRNPITQEIYNESVKDTFAQGTDSTCILTNRTKLVSIYTWPTMHSKSNCAHLECIYGTSENYVIIHPTLGEL